MNEHLRKSDFKESFYVHLDRLVGFGLETASNTSEVVNLSSKTYLGLEQNALESSFLIEKSPIGEINWRGVDNLKDRFHEALRRILGVEYRSQFLKPMIDFSVDRFEHAVIYEYAYPDSPHNPWRTAAQIFRKGILLLATDDRNLILEYDPKAFNNLVEAEFTPMGVVGNNNNDKNRCTSMIVDKRHSLQSIVFDYLKSNAQSRSFAKPVRSLVTYLMERGYAISEQMLRTRVLLPLKREGIVGSNSNGYFFLSSEDDLRVAYEHSKAAIEGMQRTLKLYRKRAETLGYNLNNFPI